MTQNCLELLEIKAHTVANLMKSQYTLTTTTCKVSRLPTKKRSIDKVDNRYLLLSPKCASQYALLEVLLP